MRCFGRYAPLIEAQYPDFVKTLEAPVEVFQVSLEVDDLDLACASALVAAGQFKDDLERFSEAVEEVRIARPQVRVPPGHVLAFVRAGAQEYAMTIRVGDGHA